MTPSDRDLEQQLADALRTATDEVPERPAPDRLAALRAHVLSVDPEGTGVSSADRPTDAAPVADRQAATLPTAGARRRTWPAVAAAAAVALLGFVGGVVAADGLPDPVRSVAVGVGLPVDPPEVVATLDAVQRLGVALDTATVAAVAGDLDRAALEAVATADAVMLAAIREVDPDDLARLRPVAHQVHLRAVALFASRGQQLPTAAQGDLEELEETSPAS